MNFKTVLALSLTIFMVSCSSAAPIDYWIDNYSGDIWFPVSVPEGETITINITNLSGYTPDGDAVFPSFFDDFSNTSTVICDGNVDRMADMAVSAADVPVVVYNDKAYCFGGYGQVVGGFHEYLNNTQVYDPDSDTWTPLADMLNNSWGAAAVGYQDKAYVFAGDAALGVQKLQIYNITNDSWSYGEVPPIGISRQGLMASTDGTNAYLIRQNYTYSYSFASNTYTKLADCPYNVSWGELVYVPNENCIVLLGGTPGAIGSVGGADVYKYYIGNSTWSELLSTGPMPVYGHTRENALYGDKIFFGYGQSPLGTFHSECYYYNLTTNTWSTRFALGTYPRDGVGCAVIDDYMYVIGGRNTTTHPYGVPYCERFDLTKLTEGSHVIPSPVKWNYPTQTGYVDVTNGILTVKGSASTTSTGHHYYQWMFAKDGCDNGETLTFRGNVTSSTVNPQFAQIGLVAPSNYTQRWSSSRYTNDFVSTPGRNYIESGNDTSSEIKQPSASYSNAWHVFDITRRGASGTAFSKDGAVIQNTALDAIGTTRYPHIAVESDVTKVEVDYMFVRQNVTTPPTVMVSENAHGMILVTITNPMGSELTDYQVKVTGLGLSGVSHLVTADAMKANAIYHGTNLTNTIESDGDIYPSRYIEETDVIVPMTVDTSSSMNMSIIEWGTVKQWTMNSSEPSASVTMVIGGLPANSKIQIIRDGLEYEKVISDGTGYIKWVYSGGFSEHTFEAHVISETIKDESKQDMGEQHRSDRSSDNPRGNNTHTSK